MARHDSTGRESNMVNVTSIEAAAVAPDQLVSYVKAISGLQSEICHKYVLHTADETGVLVAFPESPEYLEGDRGELFRKDLDAAIEAAIARHGLKNISVLAPIVPDRAPENAKKKTDRYWKLDLPSKEPGQKLRNQLKSARAKLRVGKEKWNRECAALARDFCERKNLDESTRFLFERLDSYLAESRNAVLYTARDASGTLQACAIADYSALFVAFYMFAFGQKNAPPGAADALLGEAVKESEARGFSILNLGLGINPGIEFFKKKWGAEPYFQLIETEWEIPKRGFFKRLFGKR